MAPSKKPKSALMAQAVKLGVTYGPVVYGAVKKTGWSPESLLHRGVESTDARLHALEHADHLIDGSVLTVFEGDKRIFVVFTGDKPVATHPQTRTPLPRLIEGYDLAKRVRPGSSEARTIAVPKALRRRGAKNAGTVPGTLAQTPTTPPSAPPSTPPTSKG